MLLLSGKRILVLGFFFRSNLGDDTYVHVFTRLFQKINVTPTFVSMDDLDSSHIGNADVIVCGGGDIINDYFMRKLVRFSALLTHKPCYAVSVGIAYAADAPLAQLFNHMFVRSLACKDIARSGSRLEYRDQVTVIPDIAFALPVLDSGPASPTPAKREGRERCEYNLAVCLAQPVFARRPALVELMARAVLATAHALSSSKGSSTRPVVIHLVPFNTNASNHDESDLILNARLFDSFASLMRDTAPSQIHVVQTPAEACNSVDSMRKLMDTMDGAVCMRYHSAVYAVLSRVPFFCVYTTEKMSRLISDLTVASTCTQSFSYRLETDAYGVPIDIDVDALAEQMTTSFLSVDLQTCQVPVPNMDGILSQILSVLSTDEEQGAIGVFGVLNEQSDTIKRRRQVLEQTLDALSKQEDSAADDDNEAVARATCFAATGDVSSQYMWGLLEKLNNGSVSPTMDSLYPEFVYICQDFAKASRADRDAPDHPKRDTPSQSDIENDALIRFSIARALPPRLSVNIDMSYIPQPSLNKHHRSGWSYVLSGLRALEGDAASLGGAKIVMDSYVDRTFHWARRILMAIGKIPYRVPWTGVIHHTFDQTHSEYNCVKLLECRAFLDSLPQCVCLFALSTDLATRLRAGLAARGFPDVPVHVALHPTEFQPDEASMFSIEKFIKQSPRRLVHIGAWLRQPYAIYQLETGDFHDGVPLQKCTLHGRDMTLYKPPKEDKYMDSIVETVHGQKDNKSINKYVQGLLSMLERNEKSVHVISLLDNDAYDAMLAKSIVFLNLVDASAVNTVLECIARNTPIIVNRLPAVEELLGSDYPGFYKTLLEASMLATNVTQIARMHMHLARLDKGPLELSRFVSDVHALLAKSAAQRSLIVPSKGE